MAESTKKYNGINISEGVNAEISVTPEKSIVQLKVPKNNELQSASFELMAVASDVPIEAKNISYTFASGTSQSCPKDQLSWFVADWGQPYLLDQLKIQFKDIKKSSEASGDLLKMRIKVFGNNAWTPLNPVDLFPITVKTTNLSFTPVSASKVMLEFIRQTATKGIWDQTLVQINSAVFKASSIPSDLRLMIGQDDLFQHHGVMPSGEKKVLDGFASKLNDHLAHHPGINAVPLSMESSMPSKVAFRLSDVNFVEVIRSFGKGKARQELDLHFGQQTELIINGKQNADITDFSFSFQTQLDNEYVVQAEKTDQSVLSHLCNTSHSVAQGFPVLEDSYKLTGLDLFLRTAVTPVEASLDIHPDEGGLPSAEPIDGGKMNLSLEKSEVASAWYSFRLEKPLELPTTEWWAVLNVQDGEVHWHLDSAPQDASQQRTMIQIKGHQWQPRDGYEGKVRVIAESSIPPQTFFKLARGKQEVELERGSEKAFIRQSDLETINKAKAKKLCLKISSQGKGKIILNNLKIKLKSP